MLKYRSAPARLARASQQGMVLVVALVVLVVIMIAGVAMVRSVDTATLVSGNLAFQQAATYASDKGIEAALAKIRELQGIGGALDADDSSNGYYASLRTSDSPTAGQTWQQFWDATYTPDKVVDVGVDTFKNHIYYVIHRQCAFAKPPGNGGICTFSPVVTQSTGGDQDVGGLSVSAASQVYYRITVRVTGPRRTESYVQAYVAL